MPNENGNKEVIEAIQGVEVRLSEQIQVLATHMDERFEAVDKRFGDLEGGLRAEIRQVDLKLDRVDDKLSSKIDLLAVKLVEKNVITRTDAAEIMHFDPKPKQAN